ncbi:MAG TPA: glycine--tRNA ligase subunit beta, partial [Gammaproteobacteria bacterium]|nr:glycine--tRNA ligase subunit beta [Gammaproteobacteria bacterium]
MQTETLLIEIGTEELPPKDLASLAKALASDLKTQCQKLGFSFGDTFSFATPRRLGVMMTQMPAHQGARTLQKRGPTVKAAFDAKGEPSQALTGFLHACEAQLSDLSIVKTEKGEWYVHGSRQQGQSLAELIEPLFHEVISKLPITKKMRWGNLDTEFVRPVHWLLALHGKKVLPLKAFNLTASNKTYGHRFHHPQSITLHHANDYEDALKKAKVIPDFAKRRQLILEGINTHATLIKGRVEMDEALLDEVTGLVEWPVILTAHFNPDFLSLPNEALITAMQHHQRSFAVFSQTGALLPTFIFVSNTEPEDPKNILAGNERVMSARLSDAKFFYAQDHKTPLANRLEGLHKMLFQKQLGSLFEKSKRVSK